MKQAILHFDKGDVLLLEVNGEGLIRVEGGIINNLLVLEETWRIFQGDRYLCRCQFKPELVGKLSELTQDQFDAIVDFEHLPPTNEEDERKFYRDYRYLADYDLGQFSGSESFLSKMRAVGLKLNFIEEFEDDEDPTIFHSDHTFIFKILKP